MRPSVPLAEESTVYFYDPATDTITYKWNKKTSQWDPHSGPIEP